MSATIKNGMDRSIRITNLKGSTDAVTITVGNYNEGNEDKNEKNLGRHDDDDDSRCVANNLLFFCQMETFTKIVVRR